MLCPSTGAITFIIAAAIAVTITIAVIVMFRMTVSIVVMIAAVMIVGTAIIIAVIIIILVTLAVICFWIFLQVLVFFRRQIRGTKIHAAHPLFFTKFPALFLALRMDFPAALHVLPGILISSITVMLHRLHKRTPGNAHHTQDHANCQNQKCTNASKHRTEYTKQKSSGQSSTHAGCRRQTVIFQYSLSCLWLLSKNHLRKTAEQKKRCCRSSILVQSHTVSAVCLVKTGSYEQHQRGNVAR